MVLRCRRDIFRFEIINYGTVRIFLMTLHSFFVSSDMTHLVPFSIRARSLHGCCCAAGAKSCVLKSLNHQNHTYCLNDTPDLLFTNMLFTQVSKRAYLKGTILLRMMFYVSPASRRIMRSVLRLDHSVIA